MIKRLVKVNLPNEYQRVEYLENIGNSYIEFDFEYSKVICDFEFTNTTRSLMGVGGSGNAFWGSNYGTTVMLGGNSINIGNTLRRLLYTIDYTTTSTILKVLDSTINSSAIPSNLTHYNLFRIYNTGFTAKGKLYSLQVVKNNILVRHLIPCYRKVDNVAGLYDLVSGQFFTNVGYDSFTVGEDVYEPIEIEVMKEIKAVKRYEGGELKDITKINKVINGDLKTIYI